VVGGGGGGGVGWVGWCGRVNVEVAILVVLVVGEFVDGWLEVVEIETR